MVVPEQALRHSRGTKHAPRTRGRGSCQNKESLVVVAMPAFVAAATAPLCYAALPSSRSHHSALLHEPSTSSGTSSTKVALCLAGQFRDHLASVYPALRSALLSEPALDVDVFVASWYEVGTESTHHGRGAKMQHLPHQPRPSLSQAAFEQLDWHTLYPELVSLDLERTPAGASEHLHGVDMPSAVMKRKADWYAGQLPNAWSYLKNTGAVSDACFPYTAGDGTGGTEAKIGSYSSADAGGKSRANWPACSLSSTSACSSATTDGPHSSRAQNSSIAASKRDWYRGRPG